MKKFQASCLLLMLFVQCVVESSSPRFAKRARLSSKSKSKRNAVPSKCCLPPFSAVQETNTMQYSTLRLAAEEGQSPVLIESSSGEAVAVYATDGDRELQIDKYANQVTISLHIFGATIDHDCQSDYYLASNYYLDSENRCYYANTSLCTARPQAGSCPLDMEDAEVTSLDEATGITTLRGVSSARRGASYIAEVKLRADGCVPVTVTFSPMTSKGFEPGTTFSVSETLNFVQVPFEDSFSSLLSLDLRECSYEAVEIKRAGRRGRP